MARIVRPNLTFLMAWKAEVAIPPGNEDHIIREVLSLNLGLLKHDDVGLEDVKHSLLQSAPVLQMETLEATNGEGTLVSPWLVSKWIPGQHCLAIQFGSSH